MSNTIRQPRKRPRVRSSNFRAFWWLVRMEAMFQILSPIMYGNDGDLRRRIFAFKDGRWLARRAKAPGHYYPGGRYLP